MSIDLDEAAARTRRLTEAVADIAELACDELPIEMLTALLTTIETAQRQLPTIGYDVINRLKAARVPAGGGRFRDFLANVLHISAADAGARIATAAALSADEPTLPSTAAAARHGLIGAEHVRIIRDTVDKLPNTASDDDREHFDVELAAVAVAERPEVLRREAAMLLAAFDAEQDDPQTRERSRAAYAPSPSGHRHPHHRAEKSRCGQGRFADPAGRRRAGQASRSAGHRDRHDESAATRGRRRGGADRWRLDGAHRGGAADGRPRTPLSLHLRREVRTPDLPRPLAAPRLG
jgi:hypothetical protein